jgi:hypothetical protein
MSFGFAIFILPQVYVIYEKHSFGTALTNRVFLMTLLCWIMSFIGWYSFKPASFIFRKPFLSNYSENALGVISIIFVCIGILFNFLAFQIFRTESFENQQASGIVTIFVFFQQLLFLGTGLCLTLALKNWKSLVSIFALIGILYCFYIGVLQGRRTQTLYTLFVLGIPLYVRYNLKPPRIVVAFALFAAFILVPSTDQYRRILKSSEDIGQFFQRVASEVDYTKNLRDFYIHSESIELVNAGYKIQRVYQTGEYMLGFDYWNEMVKRFIPAQIFGKDFKESLFLEYSVFTKSYQINPKPYNPKYVVGTTATGIGDSFQQFDYFGCLLYLLFGIIMKRTWMTLKQTENPFVQVFYSIMLIECLISLTHGTSWFLPGFFSTFVFLNLANRISRV